MLSTILHVVVLMLGSVSSQVTERIHDQEWCVSRFLASTAAAGRPVPTATRPSSDKPGRSARQYPVTLPERLGLHRPALPAGRLHDPVTGAGRRRALQGPHHRGLGHLPGQEHTGAVPLLTAPVQVTGAELGIADGPLAA